MSGNGGHQVTSAALLIALMVIDPHEQGFDVANASLALSTSASPRGTESPSVRTGPTKVAAYVAATGSTRWSSRSARRTP